MDPSSATETVTEVERLKKLAWADRRASSVPLFVFGGLMIVSAPLNLNGLSPWRFFYWLMAGPAAFLIVAACYRRRLVRTGVGAGRGSYVATGVVLLVAFLLVIPLWIITLPTIGFALLLIAVKQHNLYLAICAIFFGVMGGLEQIFVFDNMLYRIANRVGMFHSSYGYFSGASTIVYGVLGMMMVGAAVIAKHRETAFAHE